MSFHASPWWILTTPVYSTDTPPGTPPGTPPDMPAARAFGSQMLSTMNGIGTATASCLLNASTWQSPRQSYVTTFPQTRYPANASAISSSLVFFIGWFRWIHRGFEPGTGRTVCKCMTMETDLDRSSPFHRNAHDFIPLMSNQHGRPHNGREANQARRRITSTIAAGHAANTGRWLGTLALRWLAKKATAVAPLAHSVWHLAMAAPCPLMESTT